MEPATAPLTDQEPRHQLTGLKIDKAAQWASCLLLLIPITILVQEFVALERIDSAGGRVEIPRQPPQWLSWAGEAGRISQILSSSKVFLQDCTLDDRTWRAVLHIAGPELKVARLDATGLTDRQLAELTQKSPGLRSLTILDSRLTNQGLASLANCPELTVLSISSPELKPGWVSQLPALTSLKQLELSGLEWNPAAAVALGRFNSLQRLTLNVATFPRQLLEGDQPVWGTSLYRLELKDCTLTEPGLQLISRCESLGNLQCEAVSFPATGCQHLSRLSQIDRVRLEDCQISAEFLNQLGALPQVTWLTLNGSLIEDGALQRPGEFPELWCLDLRDTNISDAAIPSLIQCRELQEMSLSGSRITAGGLARLEASLPDCRIHHDIETVTPAHAAAD